MTHIGRSEKVFVMRVFLAVLVLIFSFQSWTKADDIRDFEIEGMSIGDSLLDYFSESEIQNIFIQKVKNLQELFIKLIMEFMKRFEFTSRLKIKNL